MRILGKRFYFSRCMIWIFAMLIGLLPLSVLADDSVLPAGAKEAEKKAAEVQDATNALKRVHVFVSGRVQGVGFRNFTMTKAASLKLTGWVRNLNDLRVELVAEGPAADIEKLMLAVGQGPGGARVDKVDRKEEPYKGEFKTFEVER